MGTKKIVDQIDSNGEICKDGVLAIIYPRHRNWFSGGRGANDNNIVTTQNTIVTIHGNNKNSRLVLI